MKFPIMGAFIALIIRYLTIKDAHFVIKNVNILLVGLFFVISSEQNIVLFPTHFEISPMYVVFCLHMTFFRLLPGIIMK